MRKMKGKLKWLLLAALSCLLLTSCKGAGGTQESETDSEVSQPDAETAGIWGNGFVYANAFNEMYLWTEAQTEPVLLTNQMFSYHFAPLENLDEDGLHQLLSGLISDIKGNIVYAPNKEAFYYPSDLWFYQVSDSLFFSVIDLYRCDSKGKQKLVPAVTNYEVGENGTIWYSQLASDNKLDSGSYTGMENLYRFDGQDHLLVGELGEVGYHSFQVVKGGDSVVYRDSAKSLYLFGPEGSVKLADTAEAGFYAAEDGSRVLYRNGNEIVSVRADQPENKKTADSKEARCEVYPLDENGEEFLVIEKSEITYSDLLLQDVPDENGEGAKLWDLLKDEAITDNIKSCDISRFNTSTGEFTPLEKGYLLKGLDYEELSPVNGFYFLEFIPEKDFAKIPFSKYFSTRTPAELLAAYEYTGAYAFVTEADTNTLYDMATGYLAGKGIWRSLDNMNITGQYEVRKTYNKLSDKLYIRIIRMVTDPQGEVVGGGEDVYEIDSAGNCQIVVESAGQALVIHDELYYIRAYDGDGIQKLFSLEDGLLSKSTGINMDRMKKSKKTGNLYYLSGVYEIFDVYSGTLTVNDGTRSTSLADQVSNFVLYGDDCVAALQNKTDENSEEIAQSFLEGESESSDRLIVIEGDTQKSIEENALFITAIKETIPSETAQADIVTYTEVVPNEIRQSAGESMAKNGSAKSKVKEIIKKEGKEEADYQITDAPVGDKADYIALTKDGKTSYIKPPKSRTKDSYLESEGAFRFEIPHEWRWGSTDLDERLEVYWPDEDIPCLLWGIEDNDMGANAFSGNWDQVCTNMKETASTVFGEQLKDMEFAKYTLEDGSDVYHLWCTFANARGDIWTASAAYRFGAKNILEFIGLDKGDTSSIGNLILYTAASYEEYDGERYREYEGSGHYKGMSIWDYKLLHNPFVLAYEQANGEVWRQTVSLDTEDYIIEWEEPVLPALIKKALEIEDRDIMASDLLLIESLILIENYSNDVCYINETELKADFSDIGSGDLLVSDVTKLKSLITLYLQIGNISDYSPLGSLTHLEDLTILAGRTVKDISFLDQLTGLQRATLRKAPTQYYVDSLSDDLWKRTCSEWGISTFAKDYDGEQGLAFDQVELPDEMK